MTDTTGMFSGELVRQRLIEMNNDAHRRGYQSPLHADLMPNERLDDIIFCLHEGACGDGDRVRLDCLVDAAAYLLAWIETADDAERCRMP